MRGTPLLARFAIRRMPHAATMLAPGSKPASQLQCTVALIKNIVGTGVLTLPAGISRLSDSGASSDEALGLGVLLMLLFGGLNGLGFLLIGEACAKTSQRSYVGAWRETLGARTSFLPALASLLLCFLAAVACASVIRDVGTDIVAGSLQLTYEELNSDAVLAAITAAVLTPLCLLPSLAPLGTASLLGVLGVLLTGGSMAARLLDGSYAPETGAFAADVMATPAFHAASDGLHLPSSGAACFFVSLVSNAYLAHYNAPGVFNECRAAERATRASIDSRPEPLGPPGTATTLEDQMPDASSLAASGSIYVSASQAGTTSTPILARLTSTQSAEEVNELFEAYIESVPSFGAESAYAAGFEDGYVRGYEDALAARADSPAGLTTEPAKEADLLRRPELAEDVAPPTDTSLGVAPFRRVVASAFVGSFALFLLVAWSGFATFGDAADSLILNNYASGDPLAQLARIGVLLAVIFEFPLLERPFRLTALELLLPVPQDTGAITRIANGPAAAVLSVSLIAGIAATGVPLDTISGLSGCTGGALLIYVAPALMTLKLRAQRRGDTESTASDGDQPPNLDATAVGLWAVTVLGAGLAVIGTMDAVRQMA